MDPIRAHKLASLCQRMPLDVFVSVHVHGGDSHLWVRVVKSEFVADLKSLDGRTNLHANLELNGIYVNMGKL